MSIDLINNIINTIVFVKNFHMYHALSYLSKLSHLIIFPMNVIVTEVNIF